MRFRRLGIRRGSVPRIWMIRANVPVNSTANMSSS